MSNLRVLMYHKVHETESDFLTVSSEVFSDQMKILKKEYSPIQLIQLYKYLKNGKALPKKAVLITFDDGYASNFNTVYPVMKDLDLPFTVFPIAAYLGQTVMYDNKYQAFLSSDQLKTMSDIAEYAHHGLLHRDLASSIQADREDEIYGSIRVLKENNIPVLPFWAYSYGSYPKKNKSDFDSLKKILHDAGIIGAFRIGNRLNSLPLIDHYKIERLDIRGNQNKLNFLLKLRFGKIL